MFSYTSATLCDRQPSAKTKNRTGPAGASARGAAKIKCLCIGESSEDSSLRSRLFLCEPLDYAALMVLMRRAWVLLTDSGGIQEEALSARVPVLVLRDTTERPEVLAAGAGLLVGTQPDRIVQAFEQLWGDAAGHRAMCTSVNPFGDGHAAQRIAHTMQFSMPQASAPWADAAMSCRTAATPWKGAPTWTGA